MTVCKTSLTSGSKPMRESSKSTLKVLRWVSLSLRKLRETLLSTSSKRLRIRVQRTLEIESRLWKPAKRANEEPLGLAFLQETMRCRSTCLRSEKNKRVLSTSCATISRLPRLCKSTPSKRVLVKFKRNLSKRLHHLWLEVSNPNETLCLKRTLPLMTDLKQALQVKLKLNLLN